MTALTTESVSLAERIENFSKMLAIHLATLEALNAQTDAHQARLVAENSWFASLDLSPAQEPEPVDEFPEVEGKIYV